MEENQVTESKGLSITSMVLGIVALVLFCFWYLSIPCAILAIVFAIIGRKKGGKGMATTGLILGIIALVIDVVLVVGVAGMFYEIFSAASSMTY